ncbi:hypothetical protein E1287_27675 [Actinomadura sp. KC06]|nr:hypothetical protein E1287_27675 [Actinomadura sp. KC06]
MSPGCQSRLGQLQHVCGRGHASTGECRIDGPLALMLLINTRRAARTDAASAIVPLAEQRRDPTRGCRSRQARTTTARPRRPKRVRQSPPTGPPGPDEVMHRA